MLPFLPNEIVDKINNMVYEIELQEHKDKFKSSIEWINREYDDIVKSSNPEISFKNQVRYGIPMRIHEDYTMWRDMTHEGHIGDKEIWTTRNTWVIYKNTEYWNEKLEWQEQDYLREKENTRKWLLLLEYGLDDDGNCPAWE